VKWAAKKEKGRREAITKNHRVQNLGLTFEVIRKNMGRKIKGKLR
jgi:hypothetical protein